MVWWWLPGCWGDAVFWAGMRSPRLRLRQRCGGLCLRSRLRPRARPRPIRPRPSPRRLPSPRIRPSPCRPRTPLSPRQTRLFRWPACR
ncbi:MAG: hypothetical protein D6790_04370 [Caldilineae bacterium]|nr:MAG: hypothetical protein D6790_04370 [Caldilineae bacterium]